MTLVRQQLLVAAASLAVLVAACSDRVDVTGVVVDRMGGGPLGGVRVEARPIAGPGGEAAAQAVTDSEGGFTLDGLSRAATYRVSASGAGYADAGIDALTPSDSPVRIETFRAAGVRGQVVDAFTDAPVVGARVIAVPRADPEGKARTRVVITDSEGRFALFETRPGLTWELEATADHHTTAGVVIEMPELGATVELEPLVINERPKVVGWVVHALTLEALGGCEVRWGAVRTTTDATGKFSLADMPNGLQRIELSCGTETVEASIRVPTRVREHFVRDRIEVLGVPESRSGLWKIDGQRLVPLETVLPLPPGLDVELPAGTVTAGLTSSSHGTKLPQARVDSGVAEQALAHATPVYGSEAVVWRLPAGAPEALGELRGTPLTRLEAATYDAVTVEGGYYVGVVAIEYLPARLYVGGGGRRLIRKASRPLVATRRIRIGEVEYGVARLDWNHGAYCIGRVRDDRWNAESGCGLLVLAGPAR